MNADTLLRPLWGLSRRVVALGLLAAALVLLPLTALAQGGDPVALDALALLSQALTMGPAGIALGVAAVLVGLVQVVRAYGSRLPGRIGEILATPKAAAVTSLSLAILGSLATTLAAGAQISLTVVLNAVLLGLTASGLFSQGKAFIQRSEKAGQDASDALQAGGKAAAQAAIRQSPGA